MQDGVAASLAGGFGEDKPTLSAIESAHQNNRCGLLRRGRAQVRATLDAKEVGICQNLVLIKERKRDSADSALRLANLDPQTAAINDVWLRTPFRRVHALLDRKSLFYASPMRPAIEKLWLLPGIVVSSTGWAGVGFVQLATWAQGP
jgi:hypothetical protein